jgi:hypothetical protein
MTPPPLHSPNLTQENEFNSVRPESTILEVGAGIGTITTLLLKTFSSRVIAYELSQFCLSKLHDLKADLPIQQSKRLIILNDLSHLHCYTNMSASNNSEIETLDRASLPLSFFGIIIDGPISNKSLSASIRNSVDLRFVFIENWRLKQRFLVSLFLFRSGFRQQYIEVEHDSVPTGGLFLVVKGSKALKKSALRIFFDLFLVLLRLVPKFLKNLWQSRGKSWKVGIFVEDANGINEDKAIND